MPREPTRPHKIQEKTRTGHHQGGQDHVTVALVLLVLYCTRAVPRDRYYIENNSFMLDRSPRFGLTIQLAGVLCHARVAVVEVCGVSEIRAWGAGRPPCYFI